MNRYKNIFLIVLSILFTLFTLFVLDKILPFIPFPTVIQGPIWLIFPPFSEEEFVSCDFRYKVKINSLGIRGDEVKIPKPKDTYRIIVLGDSYTFGWGVDITETWVYQLGQLIQVPGKRVETVNLGKPGADIHFYMDLAYKAVPLLEPDLVIFALLQGDDIVCKPEVSNVEEQISRIVQFIYPNIFELVRRKIVLRRLMAESKKAVPLQNSAEKNRMAMQQSAKEVVDKFTLEEKERFNRLPEDIKKLFLEGMLNPFLIAVAIQYPNTFLIPTTANWISKDCFEEITSLFKETVQFIHSYQAEVILFNVPQSCYVNLFALETFGKLGFATGPEMLSSVEMDKTAKMIAEILGIEFFEITEKFREIKTADNLFFPLDCHPTPQGHDLIAKFFAEKLQKWIDVR